MRLLVVGGGGREHAIVSALHHEAPTATIYCAPGNPGTAEFGTNLPISATDIDRLADAIGVKAAAPEVQEEAARPWSPV